MIIAYHIYGIELCSDYQAFSSRHSQDTGHRRTLTSANASRQTKNRDCHQCAPRHIKEGKIDVNGNRNEASDISCGITLYNV